MVILFGVAKKVFGKESGSTKTNKSTVRKSVLGLLLIVFVFPLKACFSPTHIPPRRRLPQMSERLPLYPRKPKPEERTPERLRADVLFSLGRVIKHDEEFGWLENFSERRELVALLKALLSPWKVEA